MSYLCDNFVSFTLHRETVDGTGTAADGTSAAGRDAEGRRVLVRHHRSRDPRAPGTVLRGRLGSRPQR